MDHDSELTEALTEIALASVTEGRLPAERVLPGVRALDLWSEGPFGAMLFWVDRDAAGVARPEPELREVAVTRIGGPWRSIGSGTSTVEPWEDFQAAIPPGLASFGGSSAAFRDVEDLVSWHSVRITWATAGSEVA